MAITLTSLPSQKFLATEEAQSFANPSPYKYVLIDSGAPILLSIDSEPTPEAFQIHLDIGRHVLRLEPGRELRFRTVAAPGEVIITTLGDDPGALPQRRRGGGFWQQDAF